MTNTPIHCQYCKEVISLGQDSTGEMKACKQPSVMHNSASSLLCQYDSATCTITQFVVNLMFSQASRSGIAPLVNSQ